MSTKPKAKKTKGAIIRVSQETYLELCARRKTRNAKTRLWEPWDAVIRRMLGLPNRHGERFPCKEGFLVGEKFCPDLKSARGEAILQRVKFDLDKTPKPVPVREVI